MKNLIEPGSFLYDPLNNYLFFKIFGEKGDEIQLLGFINAVLGRTGNEMFTSVEILENTTYMAEIMDGKSCTLDVRAMLPTGAMVNIEVQIDDEHNMNRRSLFYLTREYSRSLKAGEDYIELPDLIGINIVNYNYPNTRHFHSCFHLREDTEHDIILSNALEIHYINMVKYRKQKKHLDLNDPLNRWLAWFDKNSPRELREEVVRMDTAIKTADEKAFNLATMTGDDIDYWFRKKLFAMDRACAIRKAEEKGEKRGERRGEKIGEKRGEKIGEKNGARTIARNLIAKGYTPDFVSEITGLSLEEIAGL
ncbi:MAG: Rpn family recombination-promoting nuclease/putative transposase [Treponema sp.]|nr:Rpn family recombination-promoting nuclease/putative transposase [Treponema sp.]MCL2236660.1 Rpn family recombination-promoting nuclease/putative transposase [Treponema sp.]